jgi:nucleoside-triphosphatase THEP1
MIVRLNGARGVGKATTAGELVELLAEAGVRCRGGRLAAAVRLDDAGAG